MRPIFLSKPDDKIKFILCFVKIYGENTFYLIDLVIE